MPRSFLGRKNNLFNKWYWDSWNSFIQKNKLRPLIHTIHKNELRVDHQPNVRAKFIKILEEKYKGKSSLPWIWPWILRYENKSIRNKSKIDKLSFIKIKNFCAL